MEHRNLSTLSTSAIGLGCMGMSFAYGGADDQRSRDTIARGIERGITMFDTADMYGPETNERLVGPELTDHRDTVVLATKFGAYSLEIEGRSPDGRPEYVPRACDASLRRLGTDHIDLYYLHRVDPEVPIEETVGAMAHERGVTAAQLALAWVLAQGNDVVAIPGTTRPERIDENAAAVDLTLNPADLDRLDELAPQGVASGDRYPAQAMRVLNG